MEKAFGENLTEKKFSVVAYELWMYDEGWSTNGCWCLVDDAGLEEVLEAARNRWEVFKVNYAPKARVADIADEGCEDDAVHLVVDYLQFLSIKEKSEE